VPHRFLRGGSSSGGGFYFRPPQVSTTMRHGGEISRASAKSAEFPEFCRQGRRPRCEPRRFQWSREACVLCMPPVNLCFTRLRQAVR
jgi:hypothetical protein